MTIFLSSTSSDLFFCPNGNTIPMGTMQFVLRSVHCCLTITDQYYDICTFVSSCLFAHSLHRLQKISSVKLWLFFASIPPCPIVYALGSAYRDLSPNPKSGNAWINIWMAFAKNWSCSLFVLATMTFVSVFWAMCGLFWIEYYYYDSVFVGCNPFGDCIMMCKRCVHLCLFYFYLTLENLWHLATFLKKNSTSSSLHSD